ncbi:hypothetical protein HY792_07530 [Candidatus Desantisbacteria bacterium]|nr:hypothetical protein [Candidatus Desantisbacteria bacterium]
MQKKTLSILSFLVLLLLMNECVCATVIVPVKEDVAFWSPKIKSMEKRLQLAKRSGPELIVFLRQMPKGGDLHNHLSGATYSDFMLDSARKNSLNYNLTTNLFTAEPIIDGKIISLDTLESNNIYLAQFKNIYSMRGWHSNTIDGHDLFFNTFGYMNSSGRTVEEMLLEVVKRNLYENVQYLEVMVQSIPDPLHDEFKSALETFDMEDLESAYIQLKNKLADTDIVTPITQNINSREKVLRDNGIIPGDRIDVRYIQQLCRASSTAKGFFIDTFLYMAAMQADQRIVAINMVQAEDAPGSRRNFDDQMAIVDFLWQRMGKPTISLHAGELVLRDSPVESMQNRIQDSISKGHARRIGHGVAVAWEERVMDLLSRMRDKKILVEICLSSNASILGVEGNEHPFILYRRANVPVAICTDDEGVSRSNLTVEYSKAVMTYDLSYADLITLARNSLEFSFMQGESLYINQSYAMIRPEFDGVRNLIWQPGEVARKLMEANPKLKREVMLEREIIAFEESFRRTTQVLKSQNSE